MNAVNAAPTIEALLASLNPAQRRAVEHFEGPCLVLAGAGSGKTRVLTTRVCWLIREQGVPPGSILAVTFTNKAAGEMRERVAHMLGQQPRGITLSTFHALGARLLRRHAPLLGWTRSFTIYDSQQSQRQVKRSMKEARLDPKRWQPGAIRGVISDAKNQLISVEAFKQKHSEGPDIFLRKVADVYPLYQEALRDQDAVDFDDLLTLPVRLLEEKPDILHRYQEQFSFILVDEYQDTNRAQFRLLKLLAGASGNLMVVGDDDQSIYGWRGADISNILDFEETFPGSAVERLEQNYRSTSVILGAANVVIRENQGRKEKTLRTERIGGDPITLVEASDETDEARWIVEEIERRMLAHLRYDHRDFAVLYRTNAQSRALEDRFRQRGMPYQIVGGVRFYERREVQDVLAYLRLVANPLDRDAFDRIVNYPRRGLGRVTLERLSEFAYASRIGILEAAERAEEIPGLSRPGRTGLVSFAELIRRFSARAADAPVGELLDALLEELNLLSVLLSEGPDGEDRAHNVRELLAGAAEFEAERVELSQSDRDAFTDLGLFLQQVALVTDVDSHDPGADAVTLMTLHSAKGLEFPSVFISGLEEGLFPLARSYEENRLLEEERRLFYVGVTRAQDKLYLTHAKRRRRAGEVNFSPLSSFVDVLLDDVEQKRTRLARTVPRRSMRTGTTSRDGRRRDFGSQGQSQDDDFSFNQDRPSYTKGERVVHQTFGSGVIVALSGFGPDLKVTVDFAQVGRKKLMVRYAQLERDYMEVG